MPKSIAIMPKVTDPEIADLIKAIKAGKVDMMQGHATLVKQFPWLEARFISDPDYKQNFQQFWKDLKAYYHKKKGNSK
jgi:hypothetical protein